MGISLNQVSGLPLSFNQNQVGVDPAGRVRTSGQITLGEYRFSHDKQPDLWDEALIGTATSTWLSASQPYVRMTVATTNDAVIRQTRPWHPYLTGKPTFCEWTSTRYDLQAGVKKALVYGSSGNASPYNAVYDGIRIEADGEAGVNTYVIRLYRNGNLTAEIPRVDWDDQLDGTGASGLNLDILGAGGVTGWEGFNVIACDFLWLGGTAMRFMIKNGGIWYVFYTHLHAGQGYANVFMASPTQPVRYEIRSVAAAAAGEFNQICSYVSVEGVQTVSGFPRVASMGTAAFSNCNVVGTKYALVGMRLDPAKPLGIATIIHSIDLLAITNGAFYWELQINPTLLNPLTWSNSGNAGSETGVGDIVGNPSVTTVTADGIIINAGLVAGRTSQEIALQDLRRNGSLLNGTPETAVVIVSPYQANQDISATIHYNEVS